MMCAKLYLIFMLLIAVVENTVAKTCDYNNSVELKNKMYNGIKYDIGEYFVDIKTGTDRGCVCLKEICIRKCCPLGKIYDDSTFTCIENPKEFRPTIWEGTKLQEGYNLSNFHLLFTPFKCDKMKKEQKVIIGDFTEDIHLGTDGKLYVGIKALDPPTLMYGPDKYCYDNFLSEITKTIIQNALVCIVKQEEPNHFVISATCMLISCFFLLLTVCVYLVLPELRSKIHGKVMIACLSSFFVGFLLMASMLLMLLNSYLNRYSCTILSFFIYFSILAGFFWLNVMSFDIYNKFRKINDGSMRNRFLWYSLYGFGTPTVMTILLAGLEFSGLPKHNYTFLPNMRGGRCFLSGTTRLIYLYTPMLILCVANLFFYTKLVILIVQTKKHTQRLQKKDTKQVGLYVKLFIITGINWILEAISSFYPSLDNFWIITDAYNLLLGLIIFIIFVCKKNIFESLKQRFQRQKIQKVMKGPSTVSTPITPIAHSSEELQIDTISDVDKKK